MNTQYRGMAKGLHWLTVMFVIVLFALGWTMVDLSVSPLKLKLYSWHKWVGGTVFAVTVARLAWRLTHRPPRFTADLPRVLRISASSIHIGLYLGLLVMPLTGWLLSSAANVSVVLFSVLPLPDLVDPDAVLVERLSTAHNIGSWTLLALISIHVLATLWHHFIRRDDVLFRMLPGGLRRTTILALTGALLAAVVDDNLKAQTVTETWHIDTDVSEIRFVGEQLGVPIRGRFERWRADVVFDPAQPQDAHIRVVVQTASARTGIRDADDLLGRESWFYPTEFPNATFEASQLRPIQANRYEVTGTLTVRDRTRTVDVPLTVDVTTGPSNVEILKVKVTGEFTIARLDFNIGLGAWADTDTVANEVRIFIEIVGERGSQPSMSNNRNEELR